MTKTLVRILLFIAMAFAIVESSDISVPLPKLILDRIQTQSEPELKPEPRILEPESRIIGGEVAKAAIAPYIASLSISKIAYGHFCSGVVISKEWVLTAAHCVREVEQMGDNSDGILGLPVYVGLNDRNEVEKAQKRHIDFAFAHKQFDGTEGSEDIALLHVSPPFEFDENVRSIALPLLHEDFAGKRSTTYGWGLDDNDAAIFVKDLRVAHADVISAEECREALPDEAPISARTICVRVASCYGDGGSPLVIERNGFPLELIGITSWGYIPCGYDKRPTAFMAVSQYVDWIAQVQWAYSILH